MPQTLYEQLMAQRAARYAQNSTDDSYLQQAPNAGAGIGAGLLSGFGGRLQEARLEKMLQMEDARNQADAFINSIPINEHNFPIVLRLKTELSAMKPSKASLLDILTKKPDQNEIAMGRIYSLLKSVVPQDANNGRIETRDVPVDVNTGGGGMAEQLPIPTKRQQIQIPPDPTKLQYPQEGFKPIPGAGLVHSTTTGTSHVLGYDKTGNISTKDLGQDFRTPSEIAAEIRAKAMTAAREKRKTDPVHQRMVLNSGLDPEAMDQLYQNDPKTFAEMYAKAAGELRGEAKDKAEGVKDRNEHTKAATEALRNKAIAPVKMSPEERKAFDTEIESKVQQHFNNSSALQDRTNEELETHLKTIDPILADVVRGKRKNEKGEMVPYSNYSAAVDYGNKGVIKAPEQITKESEAIHKIAQQRGQKKYDNELNRWRGIYRKVMTHFRELGQEPPPPGTVKTVEQLRATAKAYGISEKDAYELMHNGFGFVIQGIDQPTSQPEQK